MRQHAAADPCAYLQRFADKQSRDEQFSQDIRNVIHGPSRTSAVGGVRTHRSLSPGLKAGAALTLHGTSAAAGINTSAAAEAHAEARAVCQQMKQSALRQDCPFDDHRLLGAGPDDRTRPVRYPTGTQESRAETTRATTEARSSGKYNRDIAQKIGAGAPFDAPEPQHATFAPSRPPRPSSRERVAPSPTPTFSDARAEAEANRGRMRGCSDLLGGYLLGDSQPAVQRKAPGSFGTAGALPPRPREEKLLPQAHMALAFGGASANGLAQERVEYLNTQVLRDANRERNRQNLSLG